MATFGDVVRSVRLRAPSVPYLLAEDFVRESFQKAWDYRSSGWSTARRESKFSVSTQKTGTASVTNGSANISGVSLILADTDVGRQFRIGDNQPVYSISSVSALNNTAILDESYEGTTAAAGDARILDAYVTMPSDFSKIIAIIDPQNFWQLRHWITDEELNVWDPQRSSTTTPWALVSRRESTLTATLGRRQYELWPYATDANEYWMFYYTRPPTLATDTALPGLFSDRGDVLRRGALAECASWPGTEERRNPYFNNALARKLREEFILELSRLEVIDEDIYPTWWETVSWVDRDTFSPLDSRYLQSRDSLSN